MSKQKSEEAAVLCGTDEMAALLPFYVAGTLGPRDSARVESWVASSEAGAHALQNALDEHEAVVHANEKIVPPPNALSRVMSAIEREPKASFQHATVRPAGPSLIDKLSEWLGAPMPAAGLALASVLLFCLGVGLGILLPSHEAERYVISSGDGPSANGPTAIITFAPDGKLADISEALSEAGASIVSGPRGRDTYVVRFAEGGEFGPLDQRLERLKARKDLVHLLIEKESAN